MAKKSSKSNSSLISGIIIAVLGALGLLTVLTPALRLASTSGVGDPVIRSTLEALFGGALSKPDFLLLLGLATGGTDCAAYVTMMEVGLWIGFIVAGLCLLLGIIKMFVQGKVAKYLNYALIALAALGILAMGVALIGYIIMLTMLADTISMISVVIPLMLVTFILVLLVCLLQKKIFR